MSNDVKTKKKISYEEMDQPLSHLEEQYIEWLSNNLMKIKVKEGN